MDFLHEAGGFLGNSVASDTSVSGRTFAESCQRKYSIIDKNDERISENK